MIAVIQRVAVLLDLFLHLLLTEHSGVDQTLGVDLAGGRVLGDHRVHARLGTGRLIRFVVTTTAVADQVDDHVTLELHAVVDRQLGNEQHCFRVVAIDVEDRRLNHLGDVSTVLGGAGIFLAAGGKADLVVDHDMNGATGFVGTGLGHLECLHDHTLTGKGRVTVDADRHHLVTGGVLAAVLTGTYRTFNHRGDDFQVGGVERQRQVNFTTGGHDVGRETLVVFHVTGAQVDDLLAFELVEQVARVLAQSVDQYVQAATVSHAEYYLVDTVGAGTLNDLIEHGDQAFTAFHAETLGARVFGAQVFLQPFSGSQTLQQMTLALGGLLRLATYAFQTLLEPATLIGIDDVHVLGADGAAVGGFQRIENLTQAGFFLADLQFTGTEHGVQVSIGQAVFSQSQISDLFPLPQSQWIKSRSLVATHAIGLNQAQYTDLFLVAFAADLSAADGLRPAGVPCERQKVLTDSGVGNVRTGPAELRQLVKVAAPFIGDTVRIVQIELVELFNIGGIPTGQVRGTPQLLHFAVWHSWSPSIRGTPPGAKTINWQSDCHPCRTVRWAFGIVPATRPAQSRSAKPEYCRPRQIVRVLPVAPVG